MLKIRVKYKKGEEVKFISHRDLMRAFHRAIRRANIPVAYSQGYNPHIKISWGQALKVGQFSNDEFAEINLEQHMRPLELMERLNRAFPAGLEIIEAFLV